MGNSTFKQEFYLGEFENLEMAQRFMDFYVKFLFFENEPEWVTRRRMEFWGLQESIWNTWDEKEKD